MKIYQKKIRIPILLISLLLLVTLISPAFAAKECSGSCGENVRWSFDPNSGKLSIKGQGIMQNYKLNWNTNDEGISTCTKTNAPWWPYRNEIQIIEIQEGITSIGSYAFGGYVYLTEINQVHSDGYTNLSKVIIPDSVINIHDGAFFNAKSIDNITMPENLQTVGDEAFSYCISLKNVNLPETVKELGDSAFSPTGMKEITIPPSVVRIGMDAVGCNDIAKDSYGIYAPSRGFLIYGLPGSEAEKYATQYPNIFSFIENEKKDAQSTDTEFLIFKDVKNGSWYEEGVSYVARLNIMTGISSDLFLPSSMLNRAMFATILYRLENEPEIDSSNSFLDLASNQWYTNAILWANNIGIMDGYGDNKIRPMDMITREQMAVMLKRYADYLGNDTTSTSDLNQYNDKKVVSAWATDAIRWAVEKGFITGRTEDTLSPDEYTSRAETAVILMRFTREYMENES